MEFLKSCTTNIHMLEDVSYLSCYTYKGKGGVAWNGEQWKLVRKAQLELRRRNVLCIRHWTSISIFVTDSNNTVDVFDPGDYGLQLSGKTALQPATSDRTYNGCSTRELFLKAVEGAIAFKLAQQHGTQHVGPWTWITSRDVECDAAVHDAVLIRLHANFSSTGNLYLALETLDTGLASQAGVRYKESKYVIMAPQGVLAQPILQNSSTHVPDDNPYKQYTRSYLETEGIDVPEDAAWIVVRPGKDVQGPCILWPKDLCLVLETRSDDEDSGDLDDPDWRFWFGSNAESSFKNPLTIAEEWFHGAAQREQAVKETTPFEKTADAFNDSHSLTRALGDTNEADANIMALSPLAQRSSEQHLAASGIYPTPPDGLTQGSSNMQQIGEDDSSSMQIDPIGGASIDSTLGNDIIRPPGRDSIGSTFQQEYAIQSDDLFGDTVEEMELGDNAIGDVDFSFFDEPDDDRNVTDLDDTQMPEAPLLERASDSGNVHEHVIEEPTAEFESKDVPADLMKAVSPLIDSRLNDPDQQSEAFNAIPGAHIVPDVNINPKPEKPLSPFGIRERLLPPPVPASVAQADHIQPWEQRRSSIFAPVKFRDGFNLDSKYAISESTAKGLLGANASHLPPDIGLPKRKKYGQAGKPQAQHKLADDDSASEDDSFPSSSSSDNGTELPPKLPWESKKRKRYPDLDPGTPFSSLNDQPFSDAGADEGAYTTSAPDHLLLDTLETSPSAVQRLDELHLLWRNAFNHRSTLTQNPVLENAEDQLPRIEEVFDLKKQDLIYIAQIVGEQSISTLTSPEQIHDSPTTSSLGLRRMTTLICASIEKHLLSVFPGIEKCHLADVALLREPNNRQTTNSRPQPGQPRPPQRSDSTLVGPDYFTVPPSYVKIQRGVDNWEMLPTCLSFWESLGLGPVSGPKNITAFCVFPSNDSLQLLVEQFMIDLGATYESCKFGTHLHTRKLGKDGKSAYDGRYERGMAPVELGDSSSLAGALKAYASTCVDLGKALTHFGQSDSDRNIVVYLLHPFKGPRATQLLCACFWMLFKTYRDSMVKLHRSQGCDIVLQLLPLHHVASPGTLVMHDAKSMAMLAREVYDRCPPDSTRVTERASALPILTAPSVTLASPIPKKVGFQLCIDPPSDLLHEGSILHLAYTTSPDGQWVTAAWIDNCGQHFATTCYCLRGRSFAEIAADIWERTREILAARQVMWRVFIVTPQKMDVSASRCWRALCIKPRQQSICVTLLAVQTVAALQLKPPSPIADHSNPSAGQDFTLFTPASTPQGPTFTNSPDVSSHTNAPPTPAPSETAATMVENDPDAHLADLSDETWAVLLSPKLSSLVMNQGLSHAFLFKRGDDYTADSGLPSLGVSLLWTIQVKPNGDSDEGNVRHSELTLREVLRIYRNLTILTKARGLDHGRTTVAPLHIATVLSGITYLDGMLSSP